MTTVPNNTFTGPNDGISGGYVPLTTIESGSVDADLTKIKSDLDTHLSTLQSIYTKLDTIDSNAEVPQSASEIVSKINISAELIDINNLATTVAELSDIVTYIAAHKITTIQGDMHGETSIKSTGQTYSETPISIVTSCQNVLDEINNLRIQIHKIVGKTTWIDTPDSNINTIITKLDTVETAATADQTASEIRTLVESASDSNVFTDTDHSKLNGIETAATADQTASEIRTLVESASDSNVFTDTDHSKLNGIETAATADQTASEIRTLVESASDSNVFTDTDHSKLNGIETNIAAADYNTSEISTISLPNLTAPPGAAISRSYTVYFTGSIKMTGNVKCDDVTSSWFTFTAKINGITVDSVLFSDHNVPFSFEFDNLSFGDVIYLYLPSAGSGHTASSMSFKSNLYNAPFALTI